jgi:type I restriction-modification system DNA methylase subunit
MGNADTGAKKRGRPPKVRADASAAVATAPAGEVPAQSGAMLGFEAKLWLAADKLRNNMDAAEYKHVVLGLIFLKYISDSFEEKRAALVADAKSGADPEDADEYRADNIFWVPKEARWTALQGKAKQPTIGKLLDDAMVAIERDNPTLKGVLPKDGQESNHTTWRLAKLNLAIRGIDANIAQGESFHADAHKDLKADYVIANPPFNDSDWGGARLRDDARWRYGVPPAGNASFACWISRGSRTKERYQGSIEMTCMKSQ